MRGRVNRGKQNTEEEERETEVIDVMMCVTGISITYDDSRRKRATLVWLFKRETNITQL